MNNCHPFVQTCTCDALKKRQPRMPPASARVHLHKPAYGFLHLRTPVCGYILREMGGAPRNSVAARVCVAYSTSYAVYNLIIHMYIYIYIERERESERDRDRD